MTNVLVRNLDEQTLERLKQRAKQNKRSLQAELARILTNAANDVVDGDALLERIQKQFKGRQFSDSTELIREDRER